jgi:hypothetical protein
LETAEPFTWLKHLDKPGTKPATRLMWHLSALIVEKYGKFRAEADHPQTFYQPLSDMSSRSQTVVDLASHSPPAYTPDATGPTKHSLEGEVSFEPRAASIRASSEKDRRQSAEAFRSHKYLLPGQNESARNSVYSVLSGSSQQNPPIVSSPASSHLHIRGDLTRNARRRASNGSDDALSSARNSFSEPSENGAKGNRDSKRQSRPVDLSVQSDSENSALNPNIKFVISSDNSPREGGRIPEPTGSSNVQASENIPDNGPAASKQTLHRRSSDHSHRVLDRRRRVRTSLHSSGQLLLQAEQLRQQEADEEKINLEYERKAR